MRWLKPLPLIGGAPRSWFEIRAQDEAAAEVLIYDYIGWGGVTAQDFVTQLQAVKATELRVRLNTPGGDVFDGLAIYQALRDHPAAIDMRIDGLAASIGSVIALAGDRIAMAQAAFLMIHNAWGLVIGTAGDMRAMADTLDKVSRSLADLYVAKSGQSLEQIRTWMDEETWFSAEEALAAGFVDEIRAATVPAQARAFDLSGYQRVPAPLRAAPPADPGPSDAIDQAAKARHALMARRLALVERGGYSR